MQGFFGDSSEEGPSIPSLPPGAGALEGFQVVEGGEEEEVDALDAFMADVSSSMAASGAGSSGRSSRAEESFLMEEDDHLESFLQYSSTVAPLVPPDDVEVDEDGNRVDYNENLDLPPLDHSTITYDAFRKNVFAPPPQTLLDPAAANALRQKLDIRVRVDEGVAVPPVSPTFEGLGLSHTMTQMLKREFDQPTPIQCQTVPAALSGHDVIGIAKTGSGKTGAFLWPVIHHITQLPAPQERGSPVVLVLAPTRELAKQIYDVCRQWVKPFNFRVVNMFGGSGTMSQVQALKECCEIVVGTPGRVIHFLRKRHLRSSLIKCLCLDEADKMLDMGFEGQVRSICGQLRPDRLTLMFSATFKPNVQRLAQDLLIKPIRINVGAIGAVNLDIEQVPVVLTGPAPEDQKKQWLLAKLGEFVSEGSVLIFVGPKHVADSLADDLTARGFQAASTHGEKSQQSRHKIHFAFKNGNLPILVATDVASRGLDIGVVKTVIQYDAPKNLEVHTHRVGRTGRAGETGRAYSLVTEPRFANLLVASMTQGKQLIPPDLARLASQYKGKPFVSGRGGGGGGGGGEHNSRPVTVNSGSDSKTWHQAKQQGLKYAQGAGLGAPSAPKRHRKDAEAPPPTLYDFGSNLAQFRSSFVPEKK